MLSSGIYGSAKHVQFAKLQKSKRLSINLGRCRCFSPATKSTIDQIFSKKMQKTKPLIFWIYFIFITLSLNGQHYEADYIELINKEMGGHTEVSVTSGRVDILTADYAIEVEFANKWKQAIGQSLWYGLQTNKTPGIVLVKKATDQNKYVLQLGSALQYGGLAGKIKVWVWPDDFNTSATFPIQQYNYTPKNQLKHTAYWLTTSSNKRHNSTCRYYQKSAGNFCKSNAGIACKICGG